MKDIAIGVVLAIFMVAGAALITQDQLRRPSLLEAAADESLARLAVLRLGTGVITGIAFVGVLRWALGA